MVNKKLKPALSKLKTYMDLMRPFTLLAPGLGGIFGGIMSFYSTNPNKLPFGVHHLFALVCGAITLMLINAASNALNQVYDAEIDSEAKPFRPIPKGFISKEEAKTVSCLLYSSALLLTFMVNWAFGLAVLAITFITILYSLPPIRLKKRLWLSNLALSVSRGLLGILAAWSIFGDIFNSTPWVIGSILAVYIFGTSTTKDFGDAPVDEKYGVRTLPIVYGIRKSARFVSLFFLIPFILLAFYLIIGLLPPKNVLIMSLLPMALYAVAVLNSSSTEKLERMENTKAWFLMYTLFFLFISGFSLIYILS